MKEVDYIKELADKYNQMKIEAELLGLDLGGDVDDEVGRLLLRKKQQEFDRLKELWMKSSLS